MHNPSQEAIEKVSYYPPTRGLWSPCEICGRIPPRYNQFRECLCHLLPSKEEVREEVLLKYEQLYPNSNVGVDKASNAPSWMWITINPKPDVDANTFIETINDFVTQSKYVREGKLRYVYTFEQRCETVEELNTKDPGIHCHALIESPNEKRHRDNFITLLRKKLFKFDMIGDAQHVYAKTINDSLFLQKLRYITGHKKDETKKLKVKVDELYFKKINQPQIFFNFKYEEI